MMADELKSERLEERSHKYVGGETALVFQMSCSSEQKVDLERPNRSLMLLGCLIIGPCVLSKKL